MKPLTPDRAVRIAEGARSLNGPVAAEFFNAMLIYVSKGFSIEQAANELVENGCMVPAAELASMYKRKILECL